MFLTAWFICSGICFGWYMTREIDESLWKTITVILLGPIGLGMKVGHMVTEQRRLANELAGLIRETKPEA